MTTPIQQPQQPNKPLQPHEPGFWDHHTSKLPKSGI